MYFTNGASKALKKLVFAKQQKCKLLRNPAVLRSNMEHEMRQAATAVPKFKKRGHGIFIANRFRHTPKSVDCALCTELKQKKCGIAHCPYLVEKIEAGVVGYKTLVDDCLREYE